MHDSTHQLEKFVFATTWLTPRFDTRLIALPPVGEVLLVKLQFENDATLATSSASFGTKLS